MAALQRYQIQSKKKKKKKKEKKSKSIDRPTRESLQMATLAHFPHCQAGLRLDWGHL